MLLYRHLAEKVGWNSVKWLYCEKLWFHFQDLCGMTSVRRLLSMCTNTNERINVFFNSQILTFYIQSLSKNLGLPSLVCCKSTAAFIGGFSPFLSFVPLFPSSTNPEQLHNFHFISEFSRGFIKRCWKVFNINSLFQKCETNAEIQDTGKAVPPLSLSRYFGMNAFPESLTEWQ